MIDSVRTLKHLACATAVLWLLSACAAKSNLQQSTTDGAAARAAEFDATQSENMPLKAGLALVRDCPLAGDALAATMLTLLNQTRAKARSCGQEDWAAAPALVLNDKLTLAAAGHTADMATRDFFSHTGTDGRTADSRITEVNYQWAAIAENLAGGQLEPARVIQDWLESPGHCANIMRPAYTELGVSCFRNSDTELKILWTAVFARPIDSQETF